VGDVVGVVMGYKWCIGFLKTVGESSSTQGVSASAVAGPSGMQGGLEANSEKKAGGSSIKYQCSNIEHMQDVSGVLGGEDANERFQEIMNRFCEKVKSGEIPTRAVEFILKKESMNRCCEKVKSGDIPTHAVEFIMKKESEESASEKAQTAAMIRKLTMQLESKDKQFERFKTFGVITVVALFLIAVGFKAWAMMHELQTCNDNIATCNDNIATFNDNIATCNDNVATLANNIATCNSNVVTLVKMHSTFSDKAFATNLEEENGNLVVGPIFAQDEHGKAVVALENSYDNMSISVDGFKTAIDDLKDSGQEIYLRCSNYIDCEEKHWVSGKCQDEKVEYGKKLIVHLSLVNRDHDK